MLATQCTFDYAILQAESRIVVQQKTVEIRDRTRRAMEDVRDIGERLLIVKGHLEYGQFAEWLRVEFDWSIRTAQNFMAVANEFRYANFAELKIAASALYLLASPSTPPQLRAEIIEQAQAGEKITHADVKAKLDATRHTPARSAPVRHVKDSAQNVPDYDESHSLPDEGPVIRVEPDIDSIEAAQLRRAAADASDDLLKRATGQPASSAPTRSEAADRLTDGTTLPLQQPREVAALAQVTAAVSEPVPYDPPPPKPVLFYDGAAPTEQKPASNGIVHPATVNLLGEREPTFEPDRVTADAAFISAMDQIWQRKKVVDRMGGIEHLIECWEPDVTTRFLNNFRKLREWCDEVIPKLQRGAKCSRRQSTRGS